MVARSEAGGVARIAVLLISMTLWSGCGVSGDEQTNDAAAAAVADSAQGTALPAIGLPPELDRVLRDYERGWRARDGVALSNLFAEDGFVLSNGKPAVRGRQEIRRAYASAGGPLALRAFAFATADSVGYIVGGFARDSVSADAGKFVLALRRGADGRWLIAADIDNSNRFP
jgi:ketosteroid isomerase-like protein